jgi:hypothetical protein
MGLSFLKFEEKIYKIFIINFLYQIDDEILGSEKIRYMEIITSIKLMNF